MSRFFYRFVDSLWSWISRLDLSGGKAKVRAVIATARGIVWLLRVPDFQHCRHGGIARRAAGKQAPAAATHCQFFDYLDDRAQARGSLRMAPDERTAVVVHLHQVESGFAREDDVVDGERIVCLENVVLLDRQAGT